MALALYRKYRSRSLDEIVGQDHVTQLLRTAIQRDKVAHAYLFTGPRGVGKTSIARIVAHEINEVPYTDESTHLDIVEIDAASNNGVDDIRDLRERVQIAPVSARKKVYIIDEVHMLSKAAFNALLKTLEEPPEHVVFILATTDIDKVPATILSRTQRHTFRKATEQDIVSNLTRIARAEGISADLQALKLVAVHSRGSFRDSVSIFDQLISGMSEESLSVDTVRRSLGLANESLIESLVEYSDTGDLVNIRKTLELLEEQGVPARTTSEQLIHTLEPRIAEQPRFIVLIDSLLELGRSSHASMKLLTTLSLFATPNDSGATRAASTTPAVESPKPIPSPRASGPSVKAIESKNVTPAPDTKTKQPPQIKTAAVKKASLAHAVPFDWAVLLEYVRTHHVALHSVLSKCQPSVEGTRVTLHTKSAFYKKKLDDSRYRLMLNGAMEAVGMNGFEIETVPTGIPLKDSDAAKVAAIMGGGEEVSPNE